MLWICTAIPCLYRLLMPCIGGVAYQSGCKLVVPLWSFFGWSYLFPIRLRDNCISFFVPSTFAVPPHKFRSVWYLIIFVRRLPQESRWCIYFFMHLNFILPSPNSCRAIRPSPNFCGGAAHAMIPSSLTRILSPQGMCHVPPCVPSRLVSFYKFRLVPLY